MTPSQAAVDVQDASDHDVDIAIKSALAEAGVSLDELRDQARTSRFTSDQARIAWFVISPFVGRG